MSVNENASDMEAFEFEHGLASDERVQHEFEQLNELLALINDQPAHNVETHTDPTWRIDDYEVSRWRIVVKGNTRLDRIAQFRSELQRRDDIVDARVERFDGGEIAIRITTTGGIPMGPLERAVRSLTHDGAEITSTP
jgi:hypothetical protein